MTRTAAVLAAALVTGCSGASDHAFIEGYTRTPDPSVISVRFTTGACDRAGEPSVSEESDAVTIDIGIDRASHDEPCGSIRPKSHDVRIRLGSALGTRAVRSPDGTGAVEVPVPVPPAP